MCKFDILIIYLLLCMIILKIHYVRCFFIIIYINYYNDIKHFDLVYQQIEITFAKIMHRRRCGTIIVYIYHSSHYSIQKIHDHIKGLHCTMMSLGEVSDVLNLFISCGTLTSLSQQTIITYEVQKIFSHVAMIIIMIINIIIQHDNIVH